MTGQEIIELIFVWGFVGMCAAAMIGIAIYFARLALVGVMAAGLFWTLDRLPFLN